MAGIARHYGVSLDVISAFMRRHGLHRRSPSESNLINFSRKPLSYSRKMHLSEDEKILEASGIMLYWAEGSKSSETPCVDFANSDPRMIMLFLKFLRDIFSVDEKKLRVFPYCYADQDIGRILDFWSRTTGIARSQFSKAYIRKDFKPNARKMEHGLVHIRYSDKRLLSEIKYMIDSYSQKYAPVA